jgi:hypothetical protein
LRPPNDLVVVDTFFALNDFANAAAPKHDVEISPPRRRPPAPGVGHRIADFRRSRLRMANENKPARLSLIAQVETSLFLWQEPAIRPGNLNTGRNPNVIVLTLAIQPI